MLNKFMRMLNIKLIFENSEVSMVPYIYNLKTKYSY